MDLLSDIAIHEAGHVIVAYGCGCTIESVSITPSGGFTRFCVPRSFMVHDLVGIGMAGWAAEEAIYYATQYTPLLKAFESFAGLAGVSIFTTLFGRDSRLHRKRLRRMVERARKDIMDVGKLLGIGRLEWLPQVVFEIARPKYFDILKELDSSLYLLFNRQFKNYYDSVEIMVRTSILDKKDAISNQYFSSDEKLEIVKRLAKAIFRKKHLSSVELAPVLSKIPVDRFKG